MSLLWSPIASIVGSIISGIISGSSGGSGSSGSSGSLGSSGGSKSSGSSSSSSSSSFSPPSSSFYIPENQFSLPFEQQVENVRKNQNLSADDIWDKGGTTTGYEPDSWRYTGEVVAILPNNNVMVRDSKGLVLTMPRSYFESEYGKVASYSEAQHNLTIGGVKSMYGYEFDPVTGKVNPTNAPALTYTGSPEYYDALATYQQKQDKYNKAFTTPEEQKYQDNTNIDEGIYGSIPSPYNRYNYGGYSDSFEKRDKSGAKIGVSEDGRLNAVSRYLAEKLWKK